MKLTKTPRMMMLLAAIMIVMGCGSKGDSGDGVRKSTKGVVSDDGVATKDCGLDLTISGGTFSPDVCEFQQVSNGAECESPQESCGDNVISLADSDNPHTQIISVSLNGLATLAAGTYQFGPGSEGASFSGQLLDRGAIARHLVKGVVTLEPKKGNQQVYVTLDVLFAQDIRIQGSGRLTVKSYSAP